MSEDKSVVKPVQAPPLTALNLKSKLAGTPTGAPKFTVTVKNAAGKDVVVADPR
ncbi:MAG: Transketolase, partial [Verrucomicrobiales bacterium]|nr:Transketolase [Verrucomicrobiales bacterium]